MLNKNSRFLCYRGRLIEQERTSVGGVAMLLILGFIVVVITLLSIDGQLRKGYKQQQEIIELLKQIKEKH